MSIEDLKVYLGGAIVYLAIDYSRADAFLKFVLTAILIIFTCVRAYIAVDEYLVRRKERKQKKEQKDETEQKED